eukprot:Pompholyxophrys_sp_v1_NODE_191_length_1259_cov_3.190199.p1 type:complete len:154 gc:universal NODE_191_length_1259_cov_3.190199:516-977(+)
MTMTDGKVAAQLPDTAHATCLFGGATPKEMNNLQKLLSKHVDVSQTKYGLHTLHLWIRALESCLQIACKLDVRKDSHSRLSAEEKDVIEVRKKQVQSALWEKLGIAVDIVGGNGGNSNSGPTARRFFKNLDLTAAATGLNSSFFKKICFSCTY